MNDKFDELTKGPAQSFRRREPLKELALVFAAIAIGFQPVAGYLRSACATRLLALLLLLTLPAVVQAQFTYVTNNGTITITGYAGPAGAVSIPSLINGLPVTEIGSSAFAYYSGLTRITIPKSVANIDYRAFWACGSLTNASLGDGLINIGEGAFYSCINLPYVAIPNSVTNIGDGAFMYCEGLTNAILGDGIINLDYRAFSGCTILNSVNLGNRIRNIGNNAFEYCGLTSVAIPSSVTNIGDAAFSYCYVLNSVSLGNGIRNIGGAAFLSCRSLTSLSTIPNSVTNIGEWALFDLANLTNISVAADNPTYSSLSGVLFDRSQTTVIQCPGGHNGNYSIPQGVTNIGGWAFASSGMTNVVIPNSVVNISYGAFDHCTKLTSISIPGSVATMGEYAFGNCIKLTTVSLGDGVTDIGRVTFYYCTSLTNIVFPSSLTNIGDSAFSICTNLTGVFFQGDAPAVDLFSFSGVPNATVYYLPGTLGWGPVFAGLPTAFWALPYPLILNRGASFGVLTNVFGFTISWATNVSVVVEACTNMANPTWFPMGTNTITGGSSYFSDSQWKNYPARFYRLRSP